MPKVPKKTIKNKFYNDDFLSNYPSLINEVDKENLQPKQMMEKIKSDGDGDSNNENMVPKRNKTEKGDTFKEKVLHTMKVLLESGKRGNQRLTYSLSTLLEQMEQDLTTIQENGEHLQQMIMAHLKSVQQSNSVIKERMDCLKEILISFQKQCEEQEIDQRSEYTKLEMDLGEEIKMLHKKLIADTRREQLQTLHKSIANAFGTKY